ncbi:hypothetical protein JCM1841_002637 [Sporobolomyces salmonicolor]
MAVTSLSLPTTQQALLLHAPKERYQLSTILTPALRRDDEVLVRIVAIGLNPVDYKSADYGFALPVLPALNGRDLAGIIVHCGKGVKRLQPGDRVFGPSTDYRDYRRSAFQQYAVAAEHCLGLVPDNASFEECAAIGVGATAAALAIASALAIPIRGFAPRQLVAGAEGELDLAAPPRPIQPGDWLLIWGEAIVDRHNPEQAIEQVKALTDGRLSFALDCVSRESSAYAQRALRNDGQQSWLVGLSGLPKEGRNGVHHLQVPIKTFHTNPLVGSALMNLLESLLGSKELVLPSITVLDGGLSAVNVPNVSGGLVASKVPQRTDWSPEYNVKLAQTAEDVGFSHALTQIRFMAGYGAEYQHESVSFSQHILAHTKKLKVIAAILPGPWNPTLAAKQLASIDHYSNGRIAINVVSGWFKSEFVAINQPWLEHEERYRRSEEFIRALKGIWTAKESFTFHGNFYQYNSYPLRPQPVQKPHPEIFQGGNSVSARAMAARVSDLLLLNGQKTIADFRELIEDTKRRAVAEGREGQVRFGVNAFVIVRDTEEEALEVWRSIVGQADVAAVKAFQKEVQHAGKSSSEGKGMWSESDINDLVQYNDGFKSKLIGTPQQVADRILLFRSLGIDLVLCAFLHFQEEVERFGKEVIPLVREGELAGRGLDVEKETAISGYIYE